MVQQNSYLTVIVVHSTILYIMHHNHCLITIVCVYVRTRVCVCVCVYMYWQFTTKLCILDLSINLYGSLKFTQLSMVLVRQSL